MESGLSGEKSVGGGSIAKHIGLGGAIAGWSYISINAGERRRRAQYTYNLLVQGA